MPAQDLPEEVQSLFWDVAPGSVDRFQHADYVMERVMARGGLVAMRWLRATYSKEQLRDFLLRLGARLSPRDRAYWSLVSEVVLPATPGGGRPPWAGP
jgi:hypothetical protein